MLQRIESVLLYVCETLSASKGVEMLDINKIEYVQLNGLEIPDELIVLTNGNAGLMAFWMRDDRARMGAVAVKHKGQFIGWAAFVKEEEGIYSLGTYVASEHRCQGFGTMCLTLLMEVIRAENTLAWCKFGGSMYSEFNETYRRTIEGSGLRYASIFDHNERIKQTA